MSATTSSHDRSSLQDHTNPPISLVRAAPAQRESSTTNSSYPHRSPLVYSALLSRVAEALRSSITLSDIVKDGLTYKQAFDGRQAVDKIAYIIKTTDRNLALLLGRALDAQQYFHAITYDHRLRDSPSDVYQFRTRVESPFHSGDLSLSPVTSPHSQGTSNPTPDARSDTSSPSNEASNESDPGKHQDATAVPGSDADAAEDFLSLLPTGVFTLLTDCYSPTCRRDRLCYSVMCPRRLEQNPPNTGFGFSERVLEPGMLWIHRVSKEIVDSVSDQERRRQEAINEVIYIVRDFVRDMEYLRDVCLRSGSPDIRANEAHTLGLDNASQRVGYHPGTPSRRLYQGSILGHRRRDRSQHAPA